MIKTVIGIEGMMCEHCESHMNDVIRKAFAVKSVRSSHKKKETVVISETALDEARLRSAIAETGYTCLSIASAPYEDKGVFARISALFG